MRPMGKKLADPVPSPSEDDVTPSSEEGAPKAPRPTALSGLKREVSLKGFKNNPTAIQLLLDKIDSLEAQVTELSPYRKNFHERDKRVGELSEELKGVRASITGRLLLITVGGIIFGYLPSIWNQAAYLWPAFALAVIFLLVGYLKNK